jgi:hypothetical protein
MSRHREITVPEIVSGLRALAEEFESGYRPVPLPGQAGKRVAGVPVVPIVMHDALCRWRLMTRHDEIEPPVLVCAGWGLGVLLSDAEGRPVVR